MPGMTAVGRYRKGQHDRIGDLLSHSVADLKPGQAPYYGVYVLIHAAVRLDSKLEVDDRKSRRGRARPAKADMQRCTEERMSRVLYKG